MIKLLFVIVEKINETKICIKNTAYLKFIQPNLLKIVNV